MKKIAKKLEETEKEIENKDKDKTYAKIFLNNLKEIPACLKSEVKARKERK